MNDGKYVRIKEWADNEYLFTSNNVVFNEMKQPFGFSSNVMQSEWELYDERLLNEDDFGESIDRWLDNTSQCQVEKAFVGEQIGEEKSVYLEEPINKLRLGFYKLLMYTYKQDKKKAVEFLDTVTQK